MDENQVLEFYCRTCGMDAKCELYTWLVVVTPSTPHKVKVEVSTTCPDCSRVLGRGDAIIELS